jgi:hypothetical protein
MPCVSCSLFDDPGGGAWSKRQARLVATARVLVLEPLLLVTLLFLQQGYFELVNEATRDVAFCIGSRSGWPPC